MSTLGANPNFHQHIIHVAKNSYDVTINGGASVFFNYILINYTKNYFLPLFATR